VSWGAGHFIRISFTFHVSHLMFGAHSNPVAPGWLWERLRGNLRLLDYFFLLNRSASPIILASGNLRASAIALAVSRLGLLSSRSKRPT